MPAPVSQVRLAAACALMRLEAPTRDRVAKCMGVHISTLTKHLLHEGWEIPDYRRRDLRAAHDAMRAAIISRFMSGAEAGPDEAGLVDDVRDGTDPTRPADGWPPSPQGGGSASAPDALGIGVDTPVYAEMSADARLAMLADVISRQAAMILAAAQKAGGMLNKAQLDALSAIIRLAEKFETLAAERAADKQKRDDAEIAQILAKVDDRIVELAEGFIEGKNEASEGQAVEAGGEQASTVGESGAGGAGLGNGAAAG